MCVNLRSGVLVSTRDIHPCSRNETSRSAAFSDLMPGSDEVVLRLAEWSVNTSRLCTTSAESRVSSYRFLVSLLFQKAFLEKCSQKQQLIQLATDPAVER